MFRLCSYLVEGKIQQVKDLSYPPEYSSHRQLEYGIGVAQGMNEHD